MHMSPKDWYADSKGIDAKKKDKQPFSGNLQCLCFGAVDHWCVPKWLDNPSMLRDMRKVISFYQNPYKRCLLGLFSAEIT